METVTIPAEYYLLLVTLVDVCGEAEELLAEDSPVLAGEIVSEAYHAVVTWEQETGAHLAV